MTCPPLVSAGWTLRVGAGEAGAEFYLTGRGEDASAAGRGALAVVASGELDDDASREAAVLAANLFAEGYFGALATLAPVRAAARALESVNGWLFRPSDETPTPVVSLVAAILPPSGVIGWLHLGENRVYLRREGVVEALARPHLRKLASGGETLTRGLGIDETARADWFERPAAVGDRIILVGARLARALGEAELRARLARDADAETLAQELAAAAGVGAAVVVDVEGAPTRAVDLAAEFSSLPVRPPPSEGDLVDGFRIGRTLYRGRYTLLKRARDLMEEREVVLKWPLAAMQQDPVFQQGFMREGWIGSRIHSRWTVEYYDLPAERRSALYLVMPYYRGVTLAQRLEASPPATLAEGVGVGLALCDAVADLAGKQVVHGDIKPENVFLLSNGDIKLLDLGFAALSGLDESQSKGVGGTTRYMAPELFRGSRPGPSSEVFSLGVTLYRLFSGGAFPFGQREATPLARLRPDLPRWLGRVIARAIESEPAARYPDVGAMRADLLHGLAQGDWHGPPARRRELPVWFWRWAAVALALVALGHWALWRWR